MPGVPARIRERPEDFRVDEVPLGPPEGRGEHLLFQVEKRGIPTHHLVSALARALGVDRRAFGVAGRKDAQAVTTQWMSVPGVSGERLRALDLPALRVLEVGRHPRKLAVGALAGNRFQLRLRGVDPHHLPRIRLVLETLEARGVPNYFGPQRFGSRGDSAVVGRALLRNRWDEALQVMAGSPTEADTPLIREARAAFDAGRYGEAAELWPPAFREPRLVSRLLAEGKRSEEAVRAVGRRMLDLYRSAYQSWLFNALLAVRIDEIDRVRPGDLAYRRGGGGHLAGEPVSRPRGRARHRAESTSSHADRTGRAADPTSRQDQGSLVEVTDPSDFGTSLRRGELSATGPLFGPRMRRPTGEVAALEEGILAWAGVQAGEFARRRGNRRMGLRRPLRFLLQDTQVEEGADAHGPYVELRFRLDPGCYATAVVREVVKGTAGAAGAGSIAPQPGKSSTSDPGRG
ncbi:MAG: tRNA pseudouridine(13) synthase TruD [Gemmatimonadales bacterium]|nr:MAG: tRNA pseudouridine(13) synthase TruD [Gemmatimonadales bacterium]